MSLEKAVQVEIHESRYEVEKLKKIFEKEINSRRRFDDISDIKELFSVLENRNAFSPETWESLDEGLQNVINSIRNISPVPKKVRVPEKVVNLVNQNFKGDCKDLGLHLKLTEAQILKCHSVEEVLLNFEENHRGVSEKELVFRLMRALDKSNEIDLKLKILQLMEKDSL